MDNELQSFNFEGQDLTIIMINNEPWFVGKEVAKILGYKDTNQAIRIHVDDDDKLTRSFNGSGQRRQMAVVNESGLYSLILSSKLPSAKKFKKWVTSEVLPSIRKHGSYGSLPQTPEEQLMLTMQVANRTVKRVDNLEKDVEYLKQTAEITSSQARRLLEIRRQRGVELCGGKNSNFYKQGGHNKVFGQFGVDFKTKFDVPRYDAVQKKDFDEAIEYTKNWRPSYNLEQKIKEVNSQLNLLDGGLEDKKEDERED